MEALVSIVGIAALAAVDKKVTERLVKWFSFLKGDLITLASIVVGFGLATLFPGINPTDAINAAVGSPIADLPDVVTDLITGFIIAFAAGYLTDREEARTGAVVVPGEGQVAATPVVVNQTFDEGFNHGDPGYEEWVKTRPV
jgi:hypothetical protein